MPVLRVEQVLLPLAWVTSFLQFMGVRQMAGVLLLSAWVHSLLLSYAYTPYGARIIAFGLGHLIFDIAWLYVVWREYFCLWPGLIHLCYHIVVGHMARVLLNLAWVNSSFLLYGRTPYGASIIAFGLG